MKSYALALVSLTLIAAVAPAHAEAQLGKPAQNFRLKDASGRIVSLSDYKGRNVVLEWSNPECPFVKKHYDSGNMQRTQAAAVAAGAVWLTINSSANGKQGHLTPTAAQALVKSQATRRTAYLLDPSGEVGKLYGAKTTPHIYLTNKLGNLVYMGGIDDKPTANKADIAGARNHVLAAINEVRAGKAVSLASTRPYGCAVKYGDG